MNNAPMTPAKRCLKTILAMLLLVWLISMTGCSRYVVVPGGETIKVSLQQWDQMRQDNELLIIELTKCRGQK